MSTRELRFQPPWQRQFIVPPYPKWPPGMPRQRKPVQLKASTSYKAKANMDGHKEEAEGEDGGIATPESAEQEKVEQDKTGMPILYNKLFNEYLIKTRHLNKMKYQEATGRRELT